MGLSSQRSKGTRLIFPSQINPVTGEITQGDASTLDIDSDAIVLSIPLEVGFRFDSDGKTVNYLVGFGASYHGQMQGQVRTSINYPDGSVDVREVYRNTNNENVLGFSYKIFLGIENNFGNSFILGLEPYLRFASDRYRPEHVRLGQKMLYDVGLALRIRRK